MKVENWDFCVLSVAIFAQWQKACSPRKAEIIPMPILKIFIWAFVWRWVFCFVCLFGVGLFVCLQGIKNMEEDK